MSVVRHVMAEPPPPHEGLITARTCDKELGGKAWLDPIMQTITQECVGSVVEKLGTQGKAIGDLFGEIAGGVASPEEWIDLGGKIVPTIKATKDTVDSVKSIVLAVATGGTSYWVGCSAEAFKNLVSEHYESYETYKTMQGQAVKIRTILETRSRKDKEGNSILTFEDARTLYDLLTNYQTHLQTFARNAKALGVFLGDIAKQATDSYSGILDEDDHEIAQTRIRINEALNGRPRYNAYDSPNACALKTADSWAQVDYLELAKMERFAREKSRFYQVARICLSRLNAFPAAWMPQTPGQQTYYLNLWFKRTLAMEEKLKAMGEAARAAKSIIGNRCRGILQADEKARHDAEGYTNRLRDVMNKVDACMLPAVDDELKAVDALLRQSACARETGVMRLRNAAYDYRDENSAKCQQGPSSPFGGDPQGLASRECGALAPFSNVAIESGSVGQLIDASAQCEKQSEPKTYYRYCTCDYYRGQACPKEGISYYNCYDAYLPETIARTTENIARTRKKACETKQQYCGPYRTLLLPYPAGTPESELPRPPRN